MITPEQRDKIMNLMFAREEALKAATRARIRGQQDEAQRQKIAAKAFQDLNIYLSLLTDWGKV